MNEVKRRDFLKLIGAGGIGTGAGFVLGEKSKMTQELLVPQVIPPEDYSPGIATFYNTVCNLCSAGCGVSVRVREGRAKKIEGNPNHPVSQGKTCALGQAGPNGLYNPDRIRSPMKLSGARGSGSYTAISWVEAIDTLASRIGSLKSNGQGDKVHLLSGGSRGHLDTLFADFMKGIGSDNYRSYDFTYPTNLYVANKLSFDEDVLPYYDIANTRFLLSFGADYLGTWLSPVHNGVSYGKMRAGHHRGVTVQIESRMSLSGANADHWVAANPGSEALIALAMAHVIAGSGAYKGSDRDGWVAALANYAPSAVAAKAGISAEKIEHLAGDLVSHSPSLAIGGGAAASGPNGVTTLIAINALNYLAGNLNIEGGIRFNPDPMINNPFADRHASYREMVDYAAGLSSDSIDVLLVSDSNPVFNLPPSAKVAEALAKVPFIASFSSYMDETTAQADLILPVDTYLEAWADSAPEPGVGFSFASIAQPVVTRLYDTVNTGDIIIGLAQKIGGDLGAAMPWSSYEFYLKETWKGKFQSQYGGSDKDFQKFWQEALASGVWGEDGMVVNRPSKGNMLLEQVGNALTTAGFNGSESDQPYVLQPYMIQAYTDGRGANLPWMQELPDPLTSIVYGSWVEMNPATAKQAGIQEGDVLNIESTVGAIQAPVFLYPAINPGVVAMPIGQGHETYGRYAEKRGVNPLQIVAAEVDSLSGELAWSASRVKISRTGKRVNIPMTDGVSRTLGRQILSGESAHG